MIGEPVTLEEARAFMRLDPDENWDDNIIQLMICANREYLEGELGLSLIYKEGLKYKYLRGCHCGFHKKVYLPYGPVSDVEAKDFDGNTVELNNLSHEDEYPQYCFSHNVNITYNAGNWRDNFPASLKQAILMMVATNYENRENFIVGQTVTPVTQNALQLAFKYSRNLYL